MPKPVNTLKLNVDGSLGSGSLRKAFGGRARFSEDTRRARSGSQRRVLTTPR